MIMFRIKDFNEWAQCIILEMVSKYVPPDSNEVFDIMNLLEDRLQHANGAIVLATIKLFLQLTLDMTDVHQQVNNYIFNSSLSATLVVLITNLHHDKKSLLGTRSCFRGFYGIGFTISKYIYCKSP